MTHEKQAAMDRTGELSADERTTSLLAHMLDASGDKRGDEPELPEPAITGLIRAFTHDQMREYAKAARAAAMADAELLDWLEQHDDRFYNIDKITSIVGIGFWPAASIAKFETLREAIRAAIAAGGAR